jgi:hypothetical protein
VANLRPLQLVRLIADLTNGIDQQPPCRGLSNQSLCVRKCRIIDETVPMAPVLIPSGMMMSAYRLEGSTN